MTTLLRLKCIFICEEVYKKLIKFLDFLIFAIPTGPHAITQRNNKRLSGQLGLDAREQILGICSELLGQEFGAKLNESYPKGTSSLTMGLQTSLLRGRYNLIYEGTYHHKFGPANDVPQVQHSHCISTGPRSLLQQQKLKLQCKIEEELT
ncbi:hypothetical protein DPMN_021822 [Dreissena polymorpha]|uniref:Uncharacterized protein n=1 Tax=Dreissena polymorpha TaxID=45954 RepID=A0A9D4S9I3_DREPO|nr:hypothetical protein DPMN_021822 [Dreissena polymorpha]